MLWLVVIISVVSSCLCSTPIYEGEYFKAYKLDDVLYKNRLTERRQEITRDDSRNIVEFPYNGTIPADDGSALFGDLEFFGTNKDGELIIRDTIVNQNYYDKVIIYYNRSLPGYYIEDVRVFNVGRQRAFGTYAGFHPTAGYTEVDIIVPAYKIVRVFVEIYVRIQGEMGFYIY